MVVEGRWCGIAAIKTIQLTVIEPSSIYHSILVKSETSVWLKSCEKVGGKIQPRWWKINEVN